MRSFPPLSVRSAIKSQLQTWLSGRDLEIYFRQYPEERPELLQAIGQLLLKAARPFRGVDRVCQIGLVGTRAYYAASKNPVWTDRLARFEADVWLKRAILDDLPEKVRFLLGTAQEALVRNALAGWGREMTKVLSLATDPVQVAKGKLALKAVQSISAPSFAGVSPNDLITRAEAVRLLSGELNRRAQYLQGVAVNWNRITAPWRWPQSKLFQPIPKTVHSRAQTELLVSVTWPEPHEIIDRKIADLWARRYGVV